MHCPQIYTLFNCKITLVGPRLLSHFSKTYEKTIDSQAFCQWIFMYLVKVSIPIILLGHYNFNRVSNMFRPQLGASRYGSTKDHNCFVWIKRWQVYKLLALLGQVLQWALLVSRISIKIDIWAVLGQIKFDLSALIG